MKFAIAVLSIALLLALACLYFCKTHCHGVVPPPAVVDERGLTPGDAAAKTIGLLPEMANLQTFAALGFRSLDEAKHVKPGAPIPIFTLRCDLLLKRDSLKTDAIKAYAFSEKKLIPLLVNDSVRSSVTVDSLPDRLHNGKADWLTVEVGGAGLMRMVDTVLQNHRKVSKLPAAAYSVLEIPNLGLSFLAYSSQAGTMIVPMDNGYPHPCSVGKAGVEMPFATAVDSLSKCPEFRSSCSAVVR